MSYLLDKKQKRKKMQNIITGVVFLLFLIYFRVGIFNGFSGITHFIFRPVVILGNNIGGKFSNMGAYFSSKKSLNSENENLKMGLDELNARLANYTIVADENIKLKEILGRKNEKVSMTLASILSKPNSSPYDTLIIDAGTNQNIKTGNLVLALGNVPIGKVAEVYANSAKVILFSNPGEKTEVVVAGRDAFMNIIGRGGGNFELILPRDFVLENGTEVHLPGMSAYVLAYMQTIVSDPRDSFQKALFTSPVNIQELKFVEVEI
ncbi:rod shape-determining protein MreC [Candidatus Nomurabacteria bacterium]|nr:rod shape-determining protein MreC [Candidatus Nomurabacteria bacterium]